MTTIGAGTRQDTSARVDPFEDLLPALAHRLDVRDIFRQLSVVASHVIPHDEATLTASTEDGAGVQLYTTTKQGAAEVCRLDETSAITDADQPRLLDVIPGTERGLQSGLSVPVRSDDQVLAVLRLFSRHPQAYSDLDLVQAERLARYLAVAFAHQRLAQQAGDAAV